MTTKITLVPVSEKGAKSVRSYEIENFGQLGKRITLGARSKVTKNKPGMKVEFFVPTVDLLIGIGKDHTAHLIMEADAWEALKKGKSVSIDTLNEFKRKFL